MFDHKEYIRNYERIHKDEIKDRKSKPFVCACGITIQQRNKGQHFKSDFHQAFLNGYTHEEIKDRSSPFVCDCGITVQQQHKGRHFTSNFHQAFLKEYAST